MNHIASTQNALVKRIRSLSAKKGRLEEGLFAFEGKKLLEEAMDHSVCIRYVLAEPAFVAENEALLARAQDANAQVYSVERAVLESVADTRTPAGVVTAADLPTTAVPNEYAAGLWVALDGIQDPGNLGAILRSADAMGAAGILLGGNSVDPYSPKAIRAAMGSTFHLPVIETDQLARELVRAADQGFSVIAALLTGADALPESLLKAFLVIGNEGNGISRQVEEVAAIRYRLAMKGRAESLNAAVCAGILMYELSRRMGE